VINRREFLARAVTTGASITAAPDSPLTWPATAHQVPRAMRETLPSRKDSLGHGNGVVSGGGRLERGW